MFHVTPHSKGTTGDAHDELLALLHEADLASDRATSGIMDRSDLQHTISQLAKALRNLLATSQQSKKERDILAMRLSRRSPGELEHSLLS
jgi:hypothetical protein